MKKYLTVEEFLNDLDSNKRAEVDLLREIILGLDFPLAESIKWNAPNYNYNSVDRITFNLMNKEGKVKLILHMGAAKKEDKKAIPVLQNTAINIEWNSNIRGTISFEGVEEIKINKEKIEETLIDWLNLTV